MKTTVANRSCFLVCKSARISVAIYGTGAARDETERMDESGLGQVRAATSALSDVDTVAWSQRFDLLSDPTRLATLAVLHRAPGINVGDLAPALVRSENVVSQALRILRRVGWVRSTRVDRNVSYQLEDENTHDLLHWIGAKSHAH